MVLKVGILILFVLASSLSSDATSSVNQIDTSTLNKRCGISKVDEAKTSDKVCTVCEQSAAQAVQYLTGNNTQQQILEFLHSSCFRLISFADECYKVVDYYVSKFFNELPFIQPEEICKRFYLCEMMEQDRETIFSGFRNCPICQDRISDAFYILKNRDTLLAYTEAFRSRCEAMPFYVEKCLPLAFEYVPQLFADLRNYLETMNVCTTLFGCTSIETKGYDYSDQGAALELEGELLLSRS